MNLSKEIVEKFLNGRCTDQELKAITDALEADPCALDAYIDKSDWDEIDAESVSMPADTRDRIDAMVMRHISKKSGRVVMIKYAAIAAGIIGFLFLVSQALFIFSGHSRTNADVAQAAVAKDTVIENTTNERKLFRLSDGSQVALSAGSSLRFKRGFTSVCRELNLKGEAWFNVATDQKRPFTVYSGTLATTALGTSFTIKAIEAEAEINVTLHSGKVVVRQTEQKKDIVLSPGNTLVFNRSTLACRVTTGTTTNDIQVVAQAKPPVPVMYMENTLTFDREPLANVFKTLQTEYKTNISFDEDNLTGLSFTGSIPPTQSLKTTLDKIAFVNDLTVTKTATNYKVSKHN